MAWLRLASICVSWALLFGADVCLGQASQEPRRPNIVFIMADDLGYADVAFHGGNAPTPHLDKLVSTGTELLQHYVAPVCSPTRTSLMTGRFWSRFNVTSPQNNRALPQGTVTLPTVLRNAGYDTCLTGKWHLGSKPEWGPNHYGFSHSYGSLAGGVSPWNHSYKMGPFAATWHRNETLITETGHVTDLITNEACQWLSQRTGKPFFLYVPFTAVHLPIKEPAEWLAKVPTAIRGDVPRHYAACVMHLDDSVGRIVATLEKIGKRQETLIIFTSDNGGSTAENNDLKYPDDNCPNGKLVGNNTPWRGQKGDLYEGGIRVPTIVNGPGIPAGGRVTTPIHIADWMPTLCSFARTVPGRHLNWDGENMAPALAGGKLKLERALYWVAPGGRSRAVRVGDRKLIASGSRNETKFELYNLATDPGEKENLATKEPQQLAELVEALRVVSTKDGDAVAKE